MSFPRLPRNAALFLDFDGTLVDIAPTPEAIVVDPALPDLVDRLGERLAGALAVVSGRAIADLDRHLAPARFRAGGLHGLEWRERVEGRIVQSPAPLSLQAFRARLLASGLAGDGVAVEDKGVAIAIHYRAAPGRGPQVLAAVRSWLAGVDDLVLIDGKMVAEVKPRAASKGTVVDRFLSLPDFEGRIPVFVGDDRTDEDGIAAAARAGGFGVKVGEGDTGASYRVAGVDDVHAWLHSLL